MLSLEDYQRYSTLDLAQLLLGCTLYFSTDSGVCAGKIVETEAYLHNDPGCHAFTRRSTANEPMFGPAGSTYVYLIYGMYYCFNVVSGPINCGEAVLIRAVEPTQGVALMQKRRNTSNPKNLCSGPGKLCMAFGINKNHNQILLNEPYLCIHKGSIPPEHVHTTTRIGLSPSKGAELPYRFYDKTSPYISKK